MGDEVKQNIKSGDSSTNIQAESVNLSGLNYEQVKDIALLVFKDNFTKLSDVAQKVAIGRAIEFTENYLRTLNERNPLSIKNLGDPGIQTALYAAQVEFAKSGDKSLFDVLTDLLVDRTIEKERNLVQIVLEESIHTVSKLTQNQLDTLTTVFLLKYITFSQINTVENLEVVLKNNFAPFFETLNHEPSLYQHLEYCRCLTISYNMAGMLPYNLSNNFLNLFRGFFSLGFTSSELKDFWGFLPTDIDDLIISNLYDKTKLQLKFENTLELDNYINNSLFDKDTKSKIRHLYDMNLFKGKEIFDYLKSLDSRFVKLYDVWEHSRMRDMNLTSVGISLAQANYRSKTGESFDLGLWIK